MKKKKKVIVLHIAQNNASYKTLCGKCILNIAFIVAYLFAKDRLNRRPICKICKMIYNREQDSKEQLLR